MIKVSVIIPNYNHSEFLEQRIQSVLNQTYQHFELIILDDASTDNSRAIIENYQDDPKINAIVYNQQNSGSTFLQWKKGIELAKGDWIWIAESDDWCEITLLQVLTDGIIRNPGCVISYCQSLMVEGNKILWSSCTENLEQFLDGEQDQHPPHLPQADSGSSGDGHRHSWRSVGWDAVRLATTIGWHHDEHADRRLQLR